MAETSLLHRLDGIDARFEEVSLLITDPSVISDMKRFVKLTKEYKDLESEFIEFASSQGMVGIKGHRSVGGFRASIYNAMPKSSVEALIATMKEFEKKH